LDAGSEFRVNLTEDLEGKLSRWLVRKFERRSAPLNPETA